MIGETIDGWRAVRELGSGPTGTVFLAEPAGDEGGAPVAVKVLHAEAASDEARVKAVIAELRTVSALAGGHVPVLRAEGLRADRRFWVTDLVPASPLPVRLASVERMPLEEGLAVAEGIARLLGDMHRQRHLHLGLKPTNVFVAGDQVKLTDFGVVALLRDREPSVAALLYASPEQCRGDESVGPASDVYSLGALLFRMIAGRLPFPHDHVARLIVAHTTEEPPSVTGVTDGPAAIDALLARALAKDPADRFASMEELAEALERASVELAEASKMHFVNSEPPSLEERQRAVADKLSRGVVQRVLSGSLELPPAPEGVTAFARLVTQTASEIDAAEVLESDEALQALLGERWKPALIVAHLARGLAAETGAAVDPRMAYLAALVLEAGRPLVDRALPAVEERLKEPDNKYVDEEVRQDVVETCHRELAVSLGYAWSLPPEVPQALPGAGVLDADMGPCLQNVLTMAVALAVTAGRYPTAARRENAAEHVERGRAILGVSADVTDRLLAELPPG